MAHGIPASRIVQVEATSRHKVLTNSRTSVLSNPEASSDPVRDGTGGRSESALRDLRRATQLRRPAQQHLPLGLTEVCGVY